jgi:hypothetical protein
MQFNFIFFFFEQLNFINNVTEFKTSTVRKINSYHSHWINQRAMNIEVEGAAENIAVEDPNQFLMEHILKHLL